MSLNPVKAWKIEPCGQVTPLTIDAAQVLGAAAAIIGDPADYCWAMWSGRRCRMAVDSDGHAKGLPFNEVATLAYRQASRPGAQGAIVGIAIIFDELEEDYL